MNAYQNSWEYLSEELRRLDLLLYIQALQSRKQQQQEYEFTAIASAAWDEFRGLVLSEEEIDNLLSENISERRHASALDISDLVEALEKMRAQIKEKRKVSIEQGVYLSLPHLSYLFQLTPFEEQIVLFCLAPELDRKYERIYAYLQNDITQKKPGVDFVLSLLCNSSEEKLAARRAFSVDALLMKYQLLQFSSESPEQPVPLLSRSLKLNNRIVNFILGIGQLDEKIDFFARLAQPPAFAEGRSQTTWEQVQTTEELKVRLRSLNQWYFQQSQQAREKLIYLFHGNYGTGKRAMAETLCQELKLQMVIADVAGMLNGRIPFEEAVWLLFREALLLPAAIYLEGFARLIEPEAVHEVTAERSEQKRAHLLALFKAFEAFSLLTFLDSETPWEPIGEFKEHLFITVEFPMPSYALRKTWWDAALTSSGFPVSDEVDADELANKFQFSGGQINDAVIKARNIALWRNPADGKIKMSDLYTACRAKSNQNLRRLTQKIQPKYTWGDIILPPDQKAQLREMCYYLKYRPLVYGEWGFERKLSLGKGLNALFSGPSGTGKTMAAEIMANELQLDLYKIDLSQVVSKYIGETEKNLNQIFTEAQTSNAILFFDEADALFGKRSEVKDAHDRYANIEIGYLLQKMEEYEGITILATNLRKNMDEAFVRRLRFSVEFPFPDRDDRRRIWEITFPPEAPRGEDIDFDYLAKQFKITGGNIKNIVLCAAFLAAEDGQTISMKHIIHAVKREFQKMGKLCREEDFGKYYHLLTSEV